jgi:translation initiation factor 5
MESEKSQKAFLGGLERLIGMMHPDTLLPKTAMVLKVAYDEDYLDEEIIIAWGKKISKRYVEKQIAKDLRKRAEAFLTWLETAEEESSEEDD